MVTLVAMSRPDPHRAAVVERLLVALLAPDTLSPARIMATRAALLEAYDAGAADERRAQAEDVAAERVHGPH